MAEANSSAEKKISNIKGSIEDDSDLILRLKSSLLILKHAYQLEAQKTMMLVKKLREMHHQVKMKSAATVVDVQVQTDTNPIQKRSFGCQYDLDSIEKSKSRHDLDRNRTLQKDSQQPSKLKLHIPLTDLMVQASSAIKASHPASLT